MLVAFVALAANAQQEVKEDVVISKKGNNTDIVTTAALTETFYVNDFTNSVSVFHKLDTVTHSANDTIIVGLDYSYNNVNWTVADADTIIVSSSQTAVQTFTGKYPYFRTWADNKITNNAGTTIKWKATVLIDTNK